MTNMTPLEHAEIRAVMQWPLYIWGDEATAVHVDCDYCGITLWLDNTGIYADPDEQNPHTNIDAWYKAISSHRFECSEAPK